MYIKVLQRNRTKRMSACACTCMCVCMIYHKELVHMITEAEGIKICSW